MPKTVCLFLVGLLATGSLFAQSEPNKADKPLGSATPPPAARQPGKPPADKVPPVSTPASAETGSGSAAAMKVSDMKNMPAFDVKNMDTSVKPAEDFYTYANGAWL